MDHPRPHRPPGSRPPELRQEPPASQHVQAPGGHVHEAHPPPTSGRPARQAAHEAHSAEAFRRRFWRCLLLTVPVLVYADLVQQLFGYTAPVFPGSRFVPLVFASAVYFYGGSVFLVGARDEARLGRPGMMTLVAVAITAAYLYSLAVEFVIAGLPLYWELATLVDVMLLGHWLELRAVGSARGALQELAKLLPDTAERLIDARVERVPLSALRVGDLVLARPGGRVPADAEVVQGESSIDESMITGESRPVPKRPGDTIIAGTVNGAGALRARVTRTGEATALAGIMRLVEAAQQSRTRAQALADRAAFYLVLVALGGGALTLVAWSVLGRPGQFALERAVTVLVIACPHALGLAIPLVVAISTTLGARHGLLVRDRLALERAK